MMPQEMAEMAVTIMTRGSVHKRWTGRIRTKFTKDAMLGDSSGLCQSRLCILLQPLSLAILALRILLGRLSCTPSKHRKVTAVTMAEL